MGMRKRLSDLSRSDKFKIVNEDSNLVYEFIRKYHEIKTTYVFKRIDVVIVCATSEDIFVEIVE